MLRSSIRSVRALPGQPISAAGRLQWRTASAQRSVVVGRRYFADEKKIDVEASKPASPPAPVSAPAASTPPPPPTPVKTGSFRRLWRLFLTLSILGGLGFAGGVWYSRINDNFHDFFTEYVPFGERAVLYLEEMDFRKRFPTISNRIKTRDTGASVKIPAQSGASWRVADTGAPAGRQSSAVDKVEAAIKDAGTTAEAKAKPKPKQSDDVARPATEPKKTSEAKEIAEVKVDKPSTAAAAAATPAVVPIAATPDKVATEPTKPDAKKVAGYKPPEVDEPSRFPPIEPLDPIKVNDAMEPVVQDLVRMLNDIIAVVNADAAYEKYGATIGKAKGELNQVGGKIKAVKAEVEKKAAEEVRSKVGEFDAAATLLVDKVEQAMAAQEARWRREFEEEMARVKNSYDERVRVLLEREQKLGEDRAANRLLEQAVTLKKEFIGDVRERVEAEREGRLARLADLSAAVADLEKLAAGWGEVVDANLRTQQLHVAVEAVRAAVEAGGSARPFVRELVALKEIAGDDAVVAAAVGSINPSAYQRGVATPAELVDRFRRVAGEVRKAALLPDEAGVASHASSWLLSKVLFRKAAAVTPRADDDDVETILARAQALLEEGELDEAAREVNQLTGWAKTLSRDWLGEVRKVLEVQQALDVIATEARLQSLRGE